ncbi:MAG: hypothetical protein EU531_09850 [Promethearchaeota archaeon]|nr:MAG: hypothetical protein EU531_09850 [Candidatus Lokiarchaeota archaeon]
MIGPFVANSLMVSSIFVIIGSIILNYWLKKQEIQPNPYFSILIMSILVLVYIIYPFLVYIIFGIYYLIFPYDLIGMYIVSSLIAAFLIKFLYKTDTLSSLRFTSWFIFLISIGWVISLSFLIPLIAAILLIF